jgi:hypothetical protein
MRRPVAFDAIFMSRHVYSRSESPKEDAEAASMNALSVVTGMIVFLLACSLLELDSALALFAALGAAEVTALGRRLASGLRTSSPRLVPGRKTLGGLR